MLKKIFHYIFNHSYVGTHLKQMIESFPEGILVLDENNEIICINTQLKSLFGWEEFELKGKSLIIVDGDYRQLVLNRIERSKGVTPAYQEGLIIKCLKKTGEEIYLNIKFSDLGMDAGEKRTLLIFSRLSESSLTLAALKESEEKYKELFDNTSDAILILDFETFVVDDINESASRLFGYKKDELIGKIPKDILSESKKLDLEGYRKQIVENSLTEGFPAHHFKRKDGTVFVGEVSRSFFYSDGRKKLISSIRDISVRLKFEERLRQSQKMEAIGKLAGGIAHDFNNILSSVLGFTELAMEDVRADTMLKDNLQEVMIAGNRAKNLIQQILTFSRKDDPEFKVVKVKSIIKEGLNLIRASLPSTIEIVSNLNSESTVFADPTQIHQIIMNLCSNAGKAMEEHGGVLTVILNDRFLDPAENKAHEHIPTGYYTEIVVEDTGSGIQDKFLKQVFDPFFTTKPIGEGTGMGLSVIQGIVKTLKGSILVDSTVGKGTIFKIYLPIVGNMTEEFVDNSNCDHLDGTERILFVDDEEALVLLWVQVLGHMGYDIKACNSSIEALNLFKENPDKFDLVITDYTMPNMTGDKLAKELLKIRPDIPIILCTGYSHNIDEHKAKKMGITAYINKPILKAELANVIRHLLDKKE